jgi:hypothetical protein
MSRGASFFIFPASLLHQPFEAVTTPKAADIGFGIWKVEAVSPDSHEGLYGSEARL